MPKAPKPCKGCGGPKPKGAGIYYCDDCKTLCSEHGRPSSTNGCKKCRAAYMRDFHKRKPEAYGQYKRNMRAKTYGITLDQLALYEAVTECEVCGNGGRLVIDHNHATEEIRGILCTGCNTALGHSGDSAEVLRKLADYLDERGTYEERL